MKTWAVTYERYVKHLLLVIFIFLFNSACTLSPRTVAEVTERKYFIDPVFREFYDYLGGETVLGKAISPVQINNQRKQQYTNNAELVYDPEKPISQRFRLSPLGFKIGIYQPQLVVPEEASDEWIEDNYVFKEFLPLYERLGGVRFVGKPITAVRYNSQKSRYEQYFENLGFYKASDDPSSEINLLAYGEWVCETLCESATPINSVIDIHLDADYPFIEPVLDLGFEITGFALTPAYMNTQGEWEQIFENIVLFTPTNDPQNVSKITLPEKLGILAQPLVSESPDSSDVFVVINGDKGHNVPDHFMEFILSHGGFDVFGAPISEPYLVEGQVQDQCFTYLCLEYDPGNKAPTQVQVKPLGYSYREIFYQP